MNDLLIIKHLFKTLLIIKMASTSNTVASSYDDNSFPSLCIPRVCLDITRERIQYVFELLNLGTIERIDMIERDTGKGYKVKKVFIHFSSWETTERAVSVRARLLNGKDVNVVYDTSPSFWKVSASRLPKQPVRSRILARSPANTVAPTLSPRPRAYAEPSPPQYIGRPPQYIGRPPLHRNTGGQNMKASTLEEGELEEGEIAV
jgi:hypothetical protein